MSKKVLSLLLSLVIVFTAVLPSFSAYATAKSISNIRDLQKAFENGGDYYQKTDVYIESNNNDTDAAKRGVSKNVTIDGNGKSLISEIKGSGSTFYQNEPVNSVFNNVNLLGNKKSEVGIWLGNGTMTFNDSTISGYSIDNVRQSAIAVGYGRLVLNNVKFSDNGIYDLYITDCGIIDINKGTQLNNLKFCSPHSRINIGENWSGEFTIDFDFNNPMPIGTVGKGADVSGIKVKEKGFYVSNRDGKLYLMSENDTLHFDMSKREKLFKGSTGFLYGAAEINVPSVDLLQGLKPDTMVQKACGGLQHPTGDATRTKSALIASGVRDMQVYFQDMYLEWPYDKPVKEGTKDDVDIDKYQESVERILYKMICDESDESNSNAFLGNDGLYYVLNKKNAEKYSYVLFNEPDQIWYGGKLSMLEKAWKQLYIAVHKIDPNARCVGPNYSGYSNNDYNAFLEYCKNNNCLPEIISWHELGDISVRDFYDHYDTTMSYVEKYYSDCDYQPQLMVNEYARHYDIGSPGGLVKWLSMFEDKDMCGCMAYWAMANSLNELAADQNSPSSSWWVYHWYAQMTGKQCPMTAPDFKNTRFYGVTSYDEKINMGYALFGGSEIKGGTERISLDNISSTALANSNGVVNVKIYGVSFSGQQGASYSSECLYDGAVSLDDNDSLTISVDNTDEMHAYFAVLTKADDSAVPVHMNATLSTLSYEAEDAKLIGGATAYTKLGWTSFATSGRADVGNINNNGDGVEFNVNISNSGTYTASIFYSLQSPYVNPQTLVPDANGQNRGIGQTLPFGVYVDGKRLPDIYLESTVSWVYKNHCDFDLALTAGNHKIRFEQINGDERYKGNLQLSAALDKLDLKQINTDSRYDFDINLEEMSNFKDSTGYRVTAVAAKAGYYTITSDADVELYKQCIDYADDAKTFSEISTFDTKIGNTVYLSKGANTIYVKGNATKLIFNYEKDKTSSCDVIFTADDMTIHGNNPQLKVNKYAESGKVISQLGIGQSPLNNDSPDKNFIEIKVSAHSEGMYNFAIRYSNDEPAPVMLKANGDTYIHPYNIDLVERYAQICVNGAAPETVYFRNTMSWDTFKTVDVQLKLEKGENIIRIYNDNSYQFSSLVNSTAPEIDTISIASLSYNGTNVEKLAKTNASNHTYTEIINTYPTCTQLGDATYVCDVCGYTYDKTLSATGHSFVSVKTIKHPTCHESGEELYACHCGEEKTVEVPALKHVAKTTVTKAQEGKNGVVVSACQSCGDKLSSKTIYAPSNFALSCSSYVYDGKEKKPTVTVTDSSGKVISSSNYTVTYKNNKNVGKASVIVSFKGNYAGIKTLTFNISPKPTSITSVTSAKKGFTVKWKKQPTQTTGYEIQYSTNSKFSKAKTVTIKKNSTTSKKITKLSAKKKYFVRVRTYTNVKVNGKTTKLYSSWSKVKNVKTK